MTAPKILCILSSLFLLLLGQLVVGQNKLSGNFYLYEDSAKNFTPVKALNFYKEGKFTLQKKEDLNVGFTRSVYWLAYQNDRQLSTDSLLIFIGHHHINKIRFYFIDDNNISLQYITGDNYPFRQRPVNATGFYFPINKKGLYLARIDKSNESLQLSFRIITNVNAVTTEATHQSIMAVLTGMIVLLIIFGSYLFIISRQRLYLFYILYIAMGWLWVLANAGYGFQYIWPNLPSFASKARPVFALAPLIFSMVFLIHYIGGIKNKLTLGTIRALNIFLIASIIFILLINQNGPYGVWWLAIQYLIPIISLVYAILIFGILIRASLNKNKLAVFYLVAIIVLIVSAILQAAFSMGQLSSFGGFLNYFGLAFGYVIEAIILTAGLVYRFNQYRMDKEVLLLKMNEQQIENTRILMSAQKEERSQVANQLHDVAGSLLSAAKLNLSSMREKGILNKEASERAAKAEEAIGMVSEMVRKLSHALSPVMMEKVGFKTSIEKVVEIVNASGKISTRLVMLGSENYNPKLKNYYTGLYSIIYELLNNIIKHSRAHHALIQVAEVEDCFTLIVEDDGQGFKDNITNEKKEPSMEGVRSKVSYYGGFFAIDKNELGGVIITIEIPIIQHEN